jgi:hypothetical protein
MAGRLEGNIDGTVTVAGRCRRGFDEALDCWVAHFVQGWDIYEGE